MSSTSHDPHASDAHAGPHGPGDHGEDHGHDDHAHEDGEALGPIDVAAWGAGIAGIVGGLIVAFCLAQAASIFG